MEYDMFSIIIPIYNTASYIKRCVDSILQQEYRDFEVILVDDGSTDGSAEICDRLAQRDSRILVIHKQNEGVAAARRTGVLAAKGDYTLFVDSDDWISDDILLVLSNSSIGKYDVVYFDYTVAGANVSTNELKHNFPVDGPVEADTALELMLDGKMQWNVWQIAVKTKLLKNIDHPIGIKIGEDLFLMYQVLTHSSSILFLRERLYYYYQRDESAVHNIRTPKQYVESFKDVWYVMDYIYKNISSGYPRLISDASLFELNQAYLNLITASSQCEIKELGETVAFLERKTTSLFRKIKNKKIKTIIKYLLIRSKIYCIKSVATFLFNKVNI